MKSFINTLLRNLLDALSQIMFSADKIIAVTADHACCRPFIRIKRIVIMKKKIYKTIFEFQQRNRNQNTIYQKLLNPNALLHLTFDFDTFEDNGLVFCRLYLNWGLLVFPHEQIQYYPFGRNTTGRGLYSLYLVSHC